MQRKNKLIISSILVSLIFLCSGIILYNNFNTFSNYSLSSKDDGQKSFLNYENYKLSTDGESFDFGGFDGKWSLIEISSPKDNEITIDDMTKISKGEFCIVVLDSDLNIVANTKSNSQNSSNKEVTVSTAKGGKYIVRIAGKEASGSFNIKVNSIKKINISHKDFFS